MHISQIVHKWPQIFNISPPKEVNSFLTPAPAFWRNLSPRLNWWLKSIIIIDKFKLKVHNTWFNDYHTKWIPPIYRHLVITFFNYLEGDVCLYKMLNNNLIDLCSSSHCLVPSQFMNKWKIFSALFTQTNETKIISLSV